MAPGKWRCVFTPALKSLHLPACDAERQPSHLGVFAQMSSPPQGWLWPWYSNSRASLHPDTPQRFPPCPTLVFALHPFTKNRFRYLHFWCMNSEMWFFQQVFSVDSPTLSFWSSVAVENMFIGTIESNILGTEKFIFWRQFFLLRCLLWEQAQLSSPLTNPTEFYTS